MRRPACLFAIAFLVYNLNLRPIPSGDTAPAALIPLTLIAGDTITLDRFAAWYQRTGIAPAWLELGRDGHYYSSFPIALPLLVTPLYAPLAGLAIPNMPVECVILLARICEKISASLIAALSAAAFLALALRLADPRTAWLLALVYAFASPTWSVSSQALWQHGASELALILALLCLVREARTPGGLLVCALAGLCAGVGVAIRLSNVVPCVLIAAYALWSRWRARQLLLFACCAAAPIIAALAYNVRIFGRALGSYPAGWLMQGNVLQDLAGLLFSPSRGLLVFCPVFLFSAIGVCLWFRGPRKPHAGIYLVCLGTAAVHLLLWARYRLWWGGFSYGPRLLTDAVPCLVILMIPAMRLIQASRAWKFAFAAALAFSIFVQSIGAFCYPNGHWDASPRSVDLRPERLWVWRDNQILRTARAGPVLVPYRIVWACLARRQSLAEALTEQNVKLW